MIRLLFALTLASSPALAAPKRVNIESMSCNDVRALLREEGEALLIIPSKRVAGLNRYGLFVDGDRSCKAPQIAQRRRVAAKDGSCFVYTCADIGRNPNRF